MKLYIEQMPASGRPLIAVDHTCWQRPEAVTLQDRTVEHSCTAVPGNRPIALGQGYSTIAWIPEASGSWALPLRHERITSWENPIDKGAWQLRQVCRHLVVRPEARGWSPGMRSVQTGTTGAPGWFVLPSHNLLVVS
jgi:hypothetical protein